MFESAGVAYTEATSFEIGSIGEAMAHSIQKRVNN